MTLFSTQSSEIVVNLRRSICACTDYQSAGKTGRDGSLSTCQSRRAWIEMQVPCVLINKVGKRHLIDVISCKVGVEQVVRYRYWAVSIYGQQHRSYSR